MPSFQPSRCTVFRHLGSVCARFSRSVPVGQQRTLPFLASWLLAGTLVSATTALYSHDGAIAQSTQPCSPPAPGEYLLLVTNPTPDVQAKLRETLPNNASTTVCQYLESAVVRVSGFTDADTANSWAQYLNEVGGIQAVVARPPSGTAVSIGGETATATPVSTQPPTAAAPSPTVPTSGSSSSYNPQALGTGYAVLVNYFNRPSVAAEVQQALARTIGLVSYNQTPYLLALYTTDPAAAAAALQNLGDRGFSAVIVDSRRVVLLTSAIATGNPAQEQASD